MLGSGIRIALGPFKFLYRFMDPQWLESCMVTQEFAGKYALRAIQHRMTIERAKLEDQKGAENLRKPYVLLHGMAERGADYIQLRNEILQALMAAQETTAALISNVIFFLSRHEAVWQRLRVEVLALKKARLTQDKLQRMNYLQNVLSESESSPIAMTSSFDSQY